MARAVLTDARAFSAASGGSTITQQLVKNLYLTQEKTVGRKVNEAVYAYKVEQQYTKDQILAMYLNNIYYGRGRTGVEDGARAWFGVSATKLTNMSDPKQVARAAFLAAVVNYPSVFSEYKGRPSNLTHRDALNQRVLYVLDGLRDLQGVLPQKMVPQSVIDRAKRLVPGLKVTDTFGSSGTSQDLDPAIVAAVHQWLVGQQTQAAKDEGYGDVEAAKQGQTQADTMLARGGLAIKTSIQADLQSALASAVRHSGLRSSLSKGVVILDPRTGGVAAMYSGHNGHADTNNNALYASQQVGSTMKPVVLAAAVANGVSVQSVFPAPPYVVANGSKVWNDDHRAAPGCQLTLADAMAVSSNTVYTQLIMGQKADCNNPANLTEISGDYPVTPTTVADLARKMGIEDSLVPGKTNPANLPEVPSLTLGVNSSSPLDMASVYATLANRGEHHDPYLVNTITASDGTVTFAHEDKSDRVIERDKADIVNQVLTGVFTHGTASGVDTGSVELAGKTGTTDTNGWGVAYNSPDSRQQFVCSAWAGYPDNRKTPGLWGAGAMRICGGFFARILHDRVHFPSADMNAGQVVGLSSGEVQTQTTPVAPVTTQVIATQPAPVQSIPTQRHKHTPTPSAEPSTVPTRSVPPAEPTGVATGTATVPGNPPPTN
jgi:membrane peptidoglycan carboxypeptidase